MGSSESLDSALDDITELVESREEGANVIIMGDFNGDIGSSGGPRGVRRATPRGESVMKLFDRHGLIPANMQKVAKGPVDTYEGQVNGSTLDYIAVPAVLFNAVTEVVVHDWAALNTSDHTPVSASLSIHGIYHASNEVTLPGHIKWNKLSP